MAIIALKTEARRGKYGVVRVRNRDGSFNREFKITEVELAVLQASANGLPPGVTRDEWVTGRAVVAGKDFEVGDMRLRKNGSLFVKYAERVVNGEIVESFVVLQPEEFSGVPPKITITVAALSTLSDRRSIKDIISGTALIRSPVLSLVDGVLETA